MHTVPPSRPRPPGVARAVAPAAAAAVGLLGAVLLFFGVGCTPAVGAACQLSTDCGSSGNLVCDTSEFEGYCTVLDCVPDQCPNNASCVLFSPSVPGCGFDDRRPSRIGQQFCMATCSSNADCRLGYVCADPTGEPWFAAILDSPQYHLVCLPLPPNGQVNGDSGPSVSPDAAVCQVTGPTWDAFPPPPDAQADGPDGD